MLVYGKSQILSNVVILSLAPQQSNRNMSTYIYYFFSKAVGIFLYKLGVINEKVVVLYGSFTWRSG